MTQWLAGMIITAAKLNDGPPTTFTTTGMTAATGWLLNDFRGYRNGRNITLDVWIHRTGEDLPLVNGQLPDVLACTAPDGWRPTSGTINGGWDDGVAEGGFVVDPDGKITLRTSSGTINGDAGPATPGSGRNLRLHADFIIDN
jgi:hypothetical protein